MIEGLANDMKTVVTNSSNQIAEVKQEVTGLSRRMDTIYDRLSKV